MNHFSLCTGIGGIDIAAEMVGFETVGQCEIADFPTKVLDKHWPNVPRWRDIRSVTKESVEATGIHRVTLLSSGIPCQPHSLAGDREGSEDERELWGEVRRIIGEIRPRWVLVENVRGFLTSDARRYFGGVLRDLDRLGYRAGWCVYGACEVGAPHERERIFVIGYSDSKPEPQTDTAFGSVRNERDTRENDSGVIRGTLSRTYWETHQPPIPGVDDVIPDRVDASKALGNAVVSEQVLPILKAIAEIEMKG